VSHPNDVVSLIETAARTFTTDSPGEAPMG
jgi:hypothetical protein